MIHSIAMSFVPDPVTIITRDPNLKRSFKTVSGELSLDKDLSTVEEFQDSPGKD